MAISTPPPVATGEALQLLAADLLDQERATVERLRALAASLELGFGWHYLLDLVWILRTARAAPGSAVIDAGAGNGLIQWYLAREGCHVLSIDRKSRANLPMRFRSRFPVRGLRPSDLGEPVAPAPAARAHRRRRPLWRLRRLVRSLLGRLGLRPRATVKPSDIGPVGGDVVIYNQDLRDLVDIPDSSVDTIVSVSSLEHNDPDQLPVVVRELLRVLKPGGRLVATLGASGGDDWFHEPSQGWCYSEATMRRVFAIPETVDGNYGDYDRILAEIRENAELRDGLSPYYFKSGDNGMPWGRWDPRYLSVGVSMVKRGPDPAA